MELEVSLNADGSVNIGGSLDLQTQVQVDKAIEVLKILKELLPNKKKSKPKDDDED